MTHREFLKLTTDLDGFMKDQGYVSCSYLAEKWGVKPVTIRVLIQKKRIVDVVAVAGKYFIADFVEKPTDLRRKKVPRKQ